MKSLRLKNLVAAAVVALTVAALSPTGASAEWKQDSNGWWNTEGSSYSTGWRTIGGSWYFFGSDGYMKTNWVNDGGTWYYLQPSGAMKTGWVSDGGKWYFTDASGAMKTGWVNDGGTWYYTAASGAMQTGWVNDGGTWYFTAASGAMQTGVVEVEGKVYYLAPSGAMATGNVTISGVTYTFAASGEAVGDKIPTPAISFSRTGAQTTPSKPSVTEPTKTSGGGGSSNNSGSSTPTFQQDINSKYADYAKATVTKTGSSSEDVTFTVSFAKTADETTGGTKVTDDYVTQDILVVNKEGSDAGITYNNGEYTAPIGSTVYSFARVYRNGQIGYVTSVQTVTK
ncbi:N-acetylmuramoyl-L-alanine amidase family protein [Clostridium chromiireducens]|uniref:N-acetylmuramoyl-L-alanine amidase family protein n=1 Tax=Clostridium chromiireducens TaxID=225345 RepID=A0A964RPW6_9CLOT|nr:N-acetylmuramoyl-L-alanine amidase family protein [Clostridium chromiireducens]MVX65627.1 N-acetylmuramoyl-L-alanine amidase family protein [Clostridium chromiireducens]